MCIAGFECKAWDDLSSACVIKGGWPYSRKQSADAVASIYKAMIKAAKGHTSTAPSSELKEAKR